MPRTVTETFARHIIAVYNYFDEDSTLIDTGEVIWIGNVSEAFKELGISGSYYSLIFRILYDNGYVSQVDRGGRDKPTTLLLHFKPEIETLLLTTTGLPATIPLVERIGQLERNTGEMNLVEALKVLDQRVSALEERL